MPNLPRIRRTRARSNGDVLTSARPRLAELHANGLAWVHLDAPDHDEAAALAHRFGWHAAELDIFLGPDYVVTLPNVELLPVTRLFRRAYEDEELRDQLFGKGSGYLLYPILDDLLDYCV